MAQIEFSHVFSPGRLGAFTVQNRIKYAACCVSNYNTRDGFLTEREYARDQVIAATGASIMTNQGAYPDKSGEGKAYHRQLCINDDKYVPGLKRISDLFHENKAVAIQQILHGGRYGGIDLGYCIQPSDTPQTLRHFRPPREMTKDEDRPGDRRPCQGSRKMCQSRLRRRGGDQFSGIPNELFSFSIYQ